MCTVHGVLLVVVTVTWGLPATLFLHAFLCISNAFLFICIRPQSVLPCMLMLMLLLQEEKKHSKRVVLLLFQHVSNQKIPKVHGSALISKSQAPPKCAQ